MGFGVIEFLVNKGAKLETNDELGQTPLSISLYILTRRPAFAARRSRADIEGK
jgi:hypothetical protein